MELSVEKPVVPDIPKKSRPFNLPSIYVKKPTGSDRKLWAQKELLGAREIAKALKRKRSSSYDNGGSVLEELRSKRSRKEVSLSSLGPAIKRHRNNLKTSRPKQDGSVFAVGTTEKVGTISGVSGSLEIANGKVRHVGNDLTIASSKKKKRRSQQVGNLGNSSGLVDSVVIPKRPRGISRWKKSEDIVSLKSATSNLKCGNSSTEVWNNESSTIVVPQSQVSNGRQRRKLNEFKEYGSSRSSSVPHIEGGSGSSIQVSSRRDQNRKKQQPTVIKETNLENEAPLIGNDEPFSGDFQDDDDENLEQNAARMLSSRFDPRCTGFSRNRMVPTTESATRSSLVQSFHQNLQDPVIEASPVDAAGRVLRPRKRNGKSFVRKRRHFYEVCSKDMDPYCIVKQRIKVFWPLDKSWYFGLVKDYDPITELHHVKYDDRDEEWINLQNERFKLLLFPSEVRSKFNSENSLERKPTSRQLVKHAMDDSGVGSLMESEPIISWLARSNRLLKSTPANIIKKQGRANPLKDFEPSISLEMKKHMAVSPSDLRSNKLFSKSDVPKRSSDEGIAEALVLKGKTGFEDRKLSYVYSRKRFRYRKDRLGNNMLEQDFACGSSTQSISILASVANRATVIEGPNVISTSVEVKQVALKLMIPTQYIHELAFGAESFWLCRAHFLMQCGKLMHVWPMVHMELIFVDNAQGLRILLFEGCLKWAVSILCVIIRTFYQHTDQSNFIELEMPCTSIGFKISGLHDQGGDLLIILYSFFKLNKSKWKCLEDKLELHCMKVKELPVAEITYSSIKNLPRKSDQIVCTSDVKDPASLEDCSEGYFSDLLQGLIPNKLFYLNTKPTVCYLDEKRGGPLQCTFFLPALASFLLSIHVKFLIENNAASVSSQKATTISSQEHPCNNDQLAADGCSLVEEPSDQVSEVTHENLGTSLAQAAASSGRRETDALSASSDGNWMKSSHDLLVTEVKVIENLVGHGDTENSSYGETVNARERLQCQIESWKGADKSSSSYPEDSFSPDKSEGGCNSSMNATNVQAQLLDEVVEGHSFGKRTQAAEPASDLVWEMNEHAIYSANPTAPRSIWHRNRHSSASCAFGHHEKLWPEDFVQNGSKKPRTQVSYSLSSGGCELGLKPQSNHRKAHTYKKIKNNNVKRSSGCLGNPQSYWESRTCDANVLVTLSDRGRRECGAQVVLESDDQQNWRICVKFSGITKYFHKVHHFLQPGTTNRYTHAMMWKGGKDWTLEFADRNQWSFFKQMHEECYNRNIRAASVKHIPIPGVRLIADGDDNIADMPFVRNPPKYFRQDGTEIDMALDPAHVLYDMDSADEEWISTTRNSCDSNGGKMIEITEDLFERVMDMCEKFAYAQQCNEFTGDEIEEFMADVGPLDVVKEIHEHWCQKRQKKGMPLIRQFQPALWELYQQQLKEWESAMNKMHSSSDGCQDKACLLKKPPMFAFCLRPRGLEVPNKGSKQRSHKKLMFTGHHNAFAREQDAFHAHGRKLNGPLVGEERTLFAIPSCESSDSFHWFPSPTSFSPRDSSRTESLLTNDSLERFPHPKLNKSNSKKMVMLPSARDSQITPFSYNQKSKRNGLYQWGLDMHDWPNTKQSQGDGYQNHRADIDEFRLRDASGAAQHALNMAKLKREKAERLLHRADVALRRALAAVMTAEAIKASEKDLIGDW
ncbi:uncharacterized protein [Elaeis guineensis]|uniref:uncharacterized protein n=1 Tax=Elaeis guineensis var. tenera TaxID=51953 RepID=UPI003C6D4411